MASSLRNKAQKGFTLVELISVIIILGILAAVITPKYFDMTTKANESVAKGVKSEAVSRFNMAYAQYVLDKGKVPTALTDLVDSANGKYLGTSAAPNVGDYVFSYALADDVVTCTITMSTGTATPSWATGGITNTVTIDWPS